MPGKHFADVPGMVRQMYDAQNGKCGYCGTDKMFIRKHVTRRYWIANKHLMATFEHIVPDSQGGMYELENGVACCQRCNTLRGNMPIEEFFEQYDELLQRLIDKPARDAAKKAMNLRKNGYIIAWYAKQIDQAVEDVCLEYMFDNSYAMIAADHGVKY